MKNPFKAIARLFRKQYIPTLPDKDLEEKYVKAGGQFGSAVSYIYMGECVGFEDMLNKWADLEKEYAARGFRTVSLDDFVSYGGYGTEITNLNQAREVGEGPIFHAELYREHFLGKMGVSNIIQNAFETGEPQFGNYAVPSTENLIK